MSYDRHMRRTLLRQRIAEILKPRELTLVRSYLGLCHPEEKGISFQELAVRLNYNGPSGAEKAYKLSLIHIFCPAGAGLCHVGRVL